MNMLPETLDIEEAAALMKAQTDTVQQIARRGDLPGTKIGKAWLWGFWIVLLRDYLD